MNESPLGASFREPVQAPAHRNWVAAAASIGGAVVVLILLIVLAA